MTAMASSCGSDASSYLTIPRDVPRPTLPCPKPPRVTQRTYQKHHARDLIQAAAIDAVQTPGRRPKVAQGTAAQAPAAELRRSVQRRRPAQTGSGWRLEEESPVARDGSETAECGGFEQRRRLLLPGPLQRSSTEGFSASSTVSLASSYTSNNLAPRSERPAQTVSSRCLHLSRRREPPAVSAVPR